MPLLSTIEACDVADAFLYTLYGDRTFARWKHLKDKMKFDMEKDYVNWLLDIADHYELTENRTASSVFASVNNIEKANVEGYNQVSANVDVSMNHSDNQISSELIADTKGERCSEFDDDGAGMDGDVDDDYEDNSSALLSQPQGTVDGTLSDITKMNEGEGLSSSIENTDGNASVLNIPPTSAQLGIKPPPALAVEAATSILSADVSQGSLRKYPCGQCDYVAKDKKHLEVHKRRHNPHAKQYKCSLCTFAAHQAGNLKQHMISKHAETSKFQCQQCQRYFTTRPLLESHAAKCKGPKKEEKRKYLCDHCAFSSNHMANLQRHIQNKHDNAELHTCPHCDYVAARKSNFKQHLICKHQYESVHKCDTCNKPFSCKAKLEQHRPKCQRLI